MKEGRKVRELDELRKYFDLQKAIEYFGNGKLQTWLSNIYASDIVEKLEVLTGEEKDFIKRFSEVLGVKCEEEINVKKIIHDSFIKEKLKQFYPEEIESIVENTADTQEYFDQLIKAGFKEIYLLSGTFSIHNKVKGIHLIGLDSPKIVIKAETLEAFKEQNISLTNVLPADEKTKKILSNDEFIIITNKLLDVLQMYLHKIN